MGETEGHVVYLGQDQQTLLNWAVNPNSCTTIAIHMVQFLMYTGDNPTVERIVEHMSTASLQWLKDYPIHQNRCEHTGVAFARLSVPNATMKPRSDLDVWGLNVVRQVSVTRNEVNLAYGFKEGLSRLVKILQDHKRPGKNVIGATVVYGAHTFAVCIKLDDSKPNKLVIDVIDSHRKVLTNPLPPRDMPFGSAVWGRFFTVESATRFIEGMYPPKTSDADLTKLSGVKLDVEATKRQRRPGESLESLARRMENENIPDGMYEVQVFAPTRRSRADAEEAIRGLCSL